MNNQSKIENRKPKTVVVGAGPAGASLAIRLARAGFEVCLVEREKFPREKLCGEFISPECLAHFENLSVLNEMLAVGGDRISQTVFYAPNGKSVSVSSAWFDAYSEGALSISRAEMDARLLEKARAAGVEVLEETSAVGLLRDDEKICGVRAKNKIGDAFEISADLTIDASGRANVLGKFAEKLKAAESKNQKSKIKNRLVGFKTHLDGVRLEKGRCEIYFFRGGYGGLSYVERNLANHCFLIKAETVKEFNSDVEQILENVIFQNRRARETMQKAKPVYDWLAVSIDGFGVKDLNPAPGLFSIGDAAAFIDPFTGSGMLMALESAEILAKVIAENPNLPEAAAEKYNILYRRKFQRRLRVCSLLRRAAFAPRLAKNLISILSLSEKARQLLARSTREPGRAKKIKS
ncbi:MAG TPA: NAD(P)/FAD-dependent oxidoreductase [Pyrinomonadaceae bacterium]|jgi:flavin-dependent dehydrogenase